MPANLVFVHDDLVLLHESCAALRAEGFTVAAFSDPMEALNCLENASLAKLLITRIRYPSGKQNGISLALMARRKVAGIKVLFVALPDTKEFIDDLGEFLAMPVSAAEVVAAVHRMLGD
jgi:DNA-binding NtrC family response regulator